MFPTTETSSGVNTGSVCHHAAWRGTCAPCAHASMQQHACQSIQNADELDGLSFCPLLHREQQKFTCHLLHPVCYPFHPGVPPGLACPPQDATFAHWFFPACRLPFACSVFACFLFACRRLFTIGWPQLGWLINKNPGSGGWLPWAGIIWEGKVHNTIRIMPSCFLFRLAFRSPHNGQWPCHLSAPPPPPPPMSQQQQA